MYELINKNGELIEQSKYLGPVLLEISVQIGESFHSKGFWLEPIFRYRKIGFVQFEIRENKDSCVVEFIVVRTKY